MIDSLLPIDYSHLRWASVVRFCRELSLASYAILAALAAKNINSQRIGVGHIDVLKLAPQVPERKDEHSNTT
jgi:hypothetical protein